MEKLSLSNINSINDLMKISNDFSLKLNLPQNSSQLQEIVNTNWKSLSKSSPEFIEILKRLWEIMNKLNINNKRGEYLWGWLRYTTEFVMLIKYDTRNNLNQLDGIRLDKLRELRIFLLALVVVIDDIGDIYSGKSINLLKVIDLIIKGINYENSSLYKKLNNNEKEYIDFVNDLWNERIMIKFKYFENNLVAGYIKKNIRKIIRVCILKKQFNKFINQNDYKSANKLSTKILTVTLFNPTMHIKINNLLELLFLSKFINISKKELNLIDKISNILETLGRIGDDLSTWEREINQRDFTSFIARNLIIKYNENHLEVSKLSYDASKLKLVMEDLMNNYNKFLKTFINFKFNKNLEMSKWIDLKELQERYIAGISLQLLSTGKK